MGISACKPMFMRCILLVYMSYTVIAGKVYTRRRVTFNQNYVSENTFPSLKYLHDALQKNITPYVTR